MDNVLEINSKLLKQVLDECNFKYYKSIIPKLLTEYEVFDSEQFGYEIEDGNLINELALIIARNEYGFQNDSMEFTNEHNWNLCCLCNSISHLMVTLYGHMNYFIRLEDQNDENLKFHLRTIWSNK